MKVAENVNIDTFLERVKGTYMGNNYVYQVRVQFDDGGPPLELKYTTQKGTSIDQSLRKGTIESSTDYLV